MSLSVCLKVSVMDLGEECVCNNIPVYITPKAFVSVQKQPSACVSFRNHVCSFLHVSCVCVCVHLYIQILSSKVLDRPGFVSSR